jgi:m7GpppX diphosphatase
LPSSPVSALTLYVCTDADKLLEKLIIKSSSQTNYLVRETPELYAAAHMPRIAAIPASNLAWIANVLAKEKEVDRLLLDVPGDDGFLINTDPKWTSHPTSTDRSTWKHHGSVKDLYCLGLVRSRIASIRDLRARHLPLLRAMREQGLSVINGVYGVPHHQIRAFFHYPPQFYHLHVHFTSLTTDMGSGCHIERAHLLDDVIDNLAQDGEYYAKSNITIRLGEKDPLWSNIQAAQEATSGQES